MKTKLKAKSIFLAVIATLLWGSLFAFIKIGYRECGIESIGDTLLFAGVRFLISGLLICLFCLKFKRRDFVNVKTNLKPILYIGITGVVLHYAFTYTGLQLTDSSKTSIIKQLGMLFYICFSSIFIKEDKPTKEKLLGALLGFAGIIIINLNELGLSFHIGDLLIIAASFCSVFSNVFGKRIYNSVDPVTVTGFSQFGGGVILTFIALSLGGRMRMNGISGYLSLIYICASSIIAYCTWSIAVKSGELSRLFILKFLEPVFACLFSAFLLHENILQWQYLATFVLIIMGIYISQNNFHLNKKNKI